MPLKRQSDVTKAELELRKELEVRFSRVLAEVLRQPRNEAVPQVRIGSACAVSIFQAMLSICPLEVMDDLLQDFFEEAFCLLTNQLLSSPQKIKMQFESLLQVPDPSIKLEHDDKSIETCEVSVDPDLLSQLLKLDEKPKT